MFVELQENVDQVVTFAPDVRGTAATVSLVPPESTTAAHSGAATPSVVLSAVTAVGSSPDVLTLDVVTGLRVWADAWYESQDGWRAKVRPAQINGLVVTFLSAPPGTPRVGDTIKGLVMTATIPAAKLATRGTQWKLYWDVTEEDGALRRYIEMAAVVAQKFREPVTADDMRALAQDLSPGWALNRSYGFWRKLAEQASFEVREELQSREVFPHLVGNHGAFVEAGVTAAKIRLLEYGVGPKDLDPNRYREQLIAEMPARVSKAIGGAWVDRNENKTVDKTEVVGIQTAIIVRE